MNGRSASPRSRAFLLALALAALSTGCAAMRREALGPRPARPAADELQPAAARVRGGPAHLLQQGGLAGRHGRGRRRLRMQLTGAERPGALRTRLAAAAFLLVSASLPAVAAEGGSTDARRRLGAALRRSRPRAGGRADRAGHEAAAGRPDALGARSGSTSSRAPRRRAPCRPERCRRRRRLRATSPPRPPTLCPRARSATCAGSLDLEWSRPVLPPADLDDRPRTSRARRTTSRSARAGSWRSTSSSAWSPSPSGAGTAATRSSRRAAPAPASPTAASSSRRRRRARTWTRRSSASRASSRDAGCWA